jgi:hypothetical protein
MIGELSVGNHIALKGLLETHYKYVNWYNPQGIFLEGREEGKGKGKADVEPLSFAIGFVLLLLLT